MAKADAGQEHTGWSSLKNRLGGVGYALTHRLVSGDLTLNAMGLAYLTLLSLVPLLAVVFSMLKAFGVHDLLEPAVMETLAPLGSQGEQIGQQILDFVRNLSVGVLGFVGIVFLFYTIITLVHRVEKSFNQIWRIPNNRSLARTFSDYLSVILVGPVLLFSALGLKATVLSYGFIQELVEFVPLGNALLALSNALPYLLLGATFTFIYGFIPNTRVQFSAALVGGAFATLLWLITGWLFASFVVSSSNYSAVYSGFAGVILFILWIQFAWLILLVGAQVAFYWQYPPYWDEAKAPEPDVGFRFDVLALHVMALIGRAHAERQPPWTRQRLVNHLRLPLAHVGWVIERLLVHGLLVETRTTPRALLPLCDCGSIPLQEVVAAVTTEVATDPKLTELSAIVDALERLKSSALADKTVASLTAKCR